MAPNQMNRTELLAEAKRNWQTARSQMDTAKVGSKAWRTAAKEVEFWSSKMAAYECYKDWAN